MSRLTRSTTKALSVSPKERTESPLPRTRRGVTPDVSGTPLKGTPAKLRTRRASLADTPQELPSSPLRRSRRFSTTSEEVGTPTKTRNLRSARTNLKLIEQPVPEEEELKRYPSPPKRAKKGRNLANTPNDSDDEEDDINRTNEQDDMNNQLAVNKATEQTSPEGQSTTPETPKKYLRSSVVVLKKLSGKLEDAVKPSSLKHNLHNKDATSPKKVNRPEEDLEDGESSKVPNPPEKKDEDSSMSGGKDGNEEDKTVATQNNLIPTKSQLGAEVGENKNAENNISADKDGNQDHAVGASVATCAENMQDETTGKSVEIDSFTDMIETDRQVAVKDNENSNGEMNVLEAETVSNPVDVSQKSPQEFAAHWLENQSPEKCLDQTDMQQEGSEVDDGTSPVGTDSVGDLNRSLDNESQQVQSVKPVDEETINDTRTKTPEKLKTIFARSWSQSIKGTAIPDSNSPEFIDAISVKRSSVIAETSPTNSLKKTPEVAPAKRHQQFDSSASEYEDEEEEEKSTRRNDFVDDEAMEVSDGENSLSSSERAYLEANEIPVDGESLGSENTSEDEDDEDGSGKDEMGSFIVSESEIDKLSGNDSLLGSEDEIEAGPKKRFSRIIQDDTSSDEEVLEKASLEVSKPGENDAEQADLTVQETENLSPSPVNKVKSDGEKRPSEIINDQITLDAGIQFLRSVSDTCQKIINEQKRAEQLENTAKGPSDINKSHVEEKSVNLGEKKTTDSQEECETETAIHNDHSIRSSTINNETDCLNIREIDSEVEFSEPNDGRDMDSSKIALSKEELSAASSDSKEDTPITINESSTIDDNSEHLPNCRNESAEDTTGKRNTSTANKRTVAEANEAGGCRIEFIDDSTNEAAFEMKNEVSEPMKFKISVESGSELDDVETLHDTGTPRAINLSGAQTRAASDNQLINKGDTSKVNSSKNSPNMKAIETNSSKYSRNRIEDSSDSFNNEMDPHTDSIKLSETILTKEGDISDKLDLKQVDIPTAHLTPGSNGSHCSIDNSSEKETTEILAKFQHDGDKDVAISCQSVSIANNSPSALEVNMQIGKLPHSSLPNSSHGLTDYIHNAKINTEPGSEKDSEPSIVSEQSNNLDSSVKFNLNESQRPIEDQMLVDNEMSQQEDNQMGNNKVHDKNSCKNRKSWPTRNEMVCTVKGRASFSICENENQHINGKKYNSSGASTEFTRKELSERNSIGTKHQLRSSSSKNDAKLLYNRKSREMSFLRAKQDHATTDSDSEAADDIDNSEGTAPARRASENRRETTIEKGDDSMRSLNNSANISRRKTLNASKESSDDSDVPSRSKESCLVRVENGSATTDSDSDIVDDVGKREANVPVIRVSENRRESLIEKGHASMRSLNNSSIVCPIKVKGPTNVPSDESEVPLNSKKSCLVKAETENTTTDSDSDHVDGVDKRRVAMPARRVSENRRKSLIEKEDNSMRSLNNSANISHRKIFSASKESSDDSEVPSKSKESRLVRVESGNATTDSDSDVDKREFNLPVRRVSENRKVSLVDKGHASMRSLNNSTIISPRKDQSHTNESSDVSEVPLKGNQASLVRTKKENATTDSDSEAVNDVDNRESTVPTRRVSENPRKSLIKKGNNSISSLNNSANISRRKTFGPSNESSDDSEVPSRSKESCLVRVENGNVTTDSDSGAEDEIDKIEVTVSARRVSENRRKSLVEKGHASMRSFNNTTIVGPIKVKGPTNESSDESEVPLNSNKSRLVRAETKNRTTDSDSDPLDDVDKRQVAMPVRRVSEKRRNSLVEKANTSMCSLNNSVNKKLANVSQRKVSHPTNEYSDDPDVPHRRMKSCLGGAENLTTDSESGVDDNKGIDLPIRKVSENRRESKVDNGHNSSCSINNSLNTSKRKVGSPKYASSEVMTCKSNSPSQENTSSTLKTTSSLIDGQESEEGSSVTSEESENEFKNSTLEKRKESNSSLNEMQNVSKSKDALEIEEANGDISDNCDRSSGKNSRLRIEYFDKSSESSDSDYDINEYILPTDHQRQKKSQVMPKRKALSNPKTNKLLPSSARNGGSLAADIRNTVDNNLVVSSGTNDNCNNGGRAKLSRKKLKESRGSCKQNASIKGKTSCEKYDVLDSDSDDTLSIKTGKKSKNAMSLTWPKNQRIQPQESSDESSSEERQSKTLAHDGKTKSCINNAALKQVPSKKNIFSRCSDNTFGNANKLRGKSSKTLAGKTAAKKASEGTKLTQPLDDSTTRDLDSIINTAQKQVLESEDNKSLLKTISKLVSKTLKNLSNSDMPEASDSSMKSKIEFKKAKKSSRHDLALLHKPLEAFHPNVGENSTSSESVDDSKIKNMSAKTEKMLFNKLAAKSHSTPANQEKVKIKINDHTLASNDEQCESAGSIINKHPTCDDISFVINDAKKRVRRHGDKPHLAENGLPAKKKRKVVEPPTDSIPSSDNSFENYLPSKGPMKKDGVAVVKGKRFPTMKPKKFGQESKILQETIMNRIAEAKQKGKIVATEANVKVGKQNPNIPKADHIVSAFVGHRLQKKGKMKLKPCDAQDVLQHASKNITGKVEKKKIRDASNIQKSASSSEAVASSYQTSDTSDAGTSRSKSKKDEWRVTGVPKSKKTLTILGKMPSEIQARSVNQKKIKASEASYVPAKTVGAKVRTILSAGQKEIPIIDRKSSKNKSKSNKRDKDREKSPQQVWTSIGCFQVSDASYIATSGNNQIRPESYGAKTTFAVQSLKNNKRKANEAAEFYSSTALNFKRQALCNDKIQRESSKDLLRKKLKRKY